MRSIAPTHQGELAFGVEQAVERGIAQFEAARRLQFLPGGGAVEGVEHAAMHSDDDELAGMARGNAPQGSLGAVGEVAQGFAAGGGEGRVAVTPAGAQFGMQRFQRGKAMALERAEAALAQAGVEYDAQAVRRGNRFRRLPGPLQIAGVHGGQGLLGQGVGGQPGLFQPARVQRNIGMTLDARSGVPVGFAMTDGDDAGRFGRVVEHGARIVPQPFADPREVQLKL